MAEPQWTMQLANGHFHHLTLLKPHPSISREKLVKASLEAIGKFCSLYCNGLPYCFFPFVLYTVCIWSTFPWAKNFSVSILGIQKCDLVEPAKAIDFWLMLKHKVATKNDLLGKRLEWQWGCWLLGIWFWMLPSPKSWLLFRSPTSITRRKMVLLSSQGLLC